MFGYLELRICGLEGCEDQCCTKLRASGYLYNPRGVLAFRTRWREYVFVATYQSLGTSNYVNGSNIHTSLKEKVSLKPPPPSRKLRFNSISCWQTAYLGGYTGYHVRNSYNGETPGADHLFARNVIRFIGKSICYIGQL